MCRRALAFLGCEHHCERFRKRVQTESRRNEAVRLSLMRESRHLMEVFLAVAVVESGGHPRRVIQLQVRPERAQAAGG